MESGALLDRVERNDLVPENSAYQASAPAHWFAIQTKPRHEKNVAVELEMKGITSFVPLYTIRKRWSDRYRSVELPLFANYAFTKIPPQREARVAVLRTQGVVGFIGTRGMGTPIPSEEIESIQRIVQSQIAFAPYPFLTVGQSVRICGGSLDGVQGILLAKNGDQSLVVSVQIIQRSLAIRVAGYHLEPCSEPSLRTEAGHSVHQLNI